jgi:hypothetical protein
MLLVHQGAEAGDKLPGPTQISGVVLDFLCLQSPDRLEGNKVGLYKGSAAQGEYCGIS